MSCNQPTPSDARRRNKKRARLAKIRPDALQGRVILKQFRVNSRLARGGMSSVYLVRDVKSGELLAAKVLRSDLVLEFRVRERFLNESRAIQRIDHPAVVRVRSVGELDDDRLCLVMEYVHGSSLRKVLRNGPISPANAVAIIGSVSEGLAAAHEQCIIHRDLKPENVLVPQKSSGALAKLVDFGIARIIDAPRITTTQHVMGTPQYIAPEQAMGKAVDHRADIYAIGVMMYEMLTGDLPFDGNDPETLLRHHISTPPPPIVEHESDKGIPEDLKYLVMRCLSKAPANRPANMDEVLSLLARVHV
ncbi:MAG: serine/threonine protein kinase [Deltaproteobacteria bacterium]|nr:serine/threonine protein kinase [Deltaproteobacteria bacterium]